MKYISPGKKGVKVLVDGFWAKEYVNKGMRIIEQRIWESIKDDFNK